MMKLSASLLSRAKLPIGFAMLILCVLLAVWLAWQQKTAQAWVRQTLEVRNQLNQLEISAMRIDIERRGYILLGSETSLQRFEADQQKLSEVLIKLSSLIGDNPKQQTRARLLGEAIDAWFASRLHSVDLRRTGQSQEAIAIVSGAATRETTAKMLKAISDLRQEEERLLSVRQQRSAELEAIALIAAVFSLIIAIALSGASLRDRRRRILLLDRANTELESDKRKLQDAENVSLEALLKLEEGNRLLTMAEEIAKVGHWRLDTTNDTLVWSDVTRQIFGAPSSYLPQLNEAINFYVSDDRARVSEAVELALNDGVGFDFKARIVSLTGVDRHVLSSGRVERSEDGTIIALFGVIQDITDVVEADTVLQEANRRDAESNRLLTLAETIGKLGHWRLDRATGAMLWSDEARRIFGMASNTPPTKENALAAYHPDDAARVEATIKESFAQGKSYSSNARIIRPDGQTVHVFTRTEVELDFSGQPIALFGIVQDVTEQIEAETSARAKDTQYRLITDQASDLISLADEQGRYLFVSPSSSSVLGYQPCEVVGTTVYDHAHSDDHALLLRNYSELADRPMHEVTTLRFRMRRKEGSYIWMEVAARVAEEDGTPRIISVGRDITKQVKTENELGQARLQAEAAASAKASFLANMSHEIRTPMNGVIGFTELLLDGDLKPMQRSQLELIAESGRSMMSLLNDILDLSKVEAGQMKIAQEPFNLERTLEACMKLVAPAIAKKGLSSSLEISNAFPSLLRGDDLRLKQIVLNLLGNAVKFTETGGITLRAEPADNGKKILIEVQDSGIGIAADRQQAIFDEFVQADGGIVSRFGGTGLGLTISVQLARLMGGSLRLESAAGQGSRFFLTLPLTLVEDRRSNEQTPRPASVSESIVGTSDDAPRILVAEDHDINQILIRAMLERLGYRVDIAQDGAVALRMVEESIFHLRPYAIILMDLQMPVLGGIEATRQLRLSGIDGDRLPVVAITANAYADDIAACLDAGMQAHVPKPLHREELGLVLKKWIKSPVVVAPSEPLAKPSSAKIDELYRLRKQDVMNEVGALLRRKHFAGVDLACLTDMLHKLAGTAGMFGDAELGELASELEYDLSSWSETDLDEKMPEALAGILRAAAA